MRIAILGTRGIPACYGGFETFAEQLSVRLVERGHEVTVYGRSHVIDYKQPEFKGVKIRLLWAPKHKYLETLVHSILSLFDVTLRGQTDVILLCNAANSPFVWIPKLRGIPLATNVDGIERLRAKWNSFGKLWYRLGERCAVWFSPFVISDAEVIREYYQQTYGRDSKVIAYGFDERDHEVARSKAYGQEDWLKTQEVHRQLSISPGQYLLYVSRLEPENNAHVVISAYALAQKQAAKTGISLRPLVIVGDAPYAKEYIQSLKDMAPEGVIFAGYRFGEDYRNLQLGAYLYFQATEVGGTHPALVEALGFANCVLGNGTPENIEVIGGAGKIYPKNDSQALSEMILDLHQRPEEVSLLRKSGFERAESQYRWDIVCDRYEALFKEMCQKKA